MTEQDALEPEHEAAEEMSPEDFMAALRRTCQNSGRTAGRIAAAAGLPRSTAYRFVDPDNTALPKNKYQLRDFLAACGMSDGEIGAMLRTWRRLTGNSSPRTPNHHYENPSMNLVPGSSGAPDEMKNRDGKTVAQVKARQDRHEVVNVWGEPGTIYMNPPRSTRAQVAAQGEGLWVATADGDWVRADQIVRVRCDQNKVVLYLKMPQVDGIREEDFRTVLRRCRSAVAARRTASDMVYVLSKHANTTGTVRIDNTGQIVTQGFTPRRAITRAS